MVVVVVWMWGGGEEREETTLEEVQELLSRVMANRRRAQTLCGAPSPDSHTSVTLRSINGSHGPDAVTDVPFMATHIIQRRKP